MAVGAVHGTEKVVEREHLCATALKLGVPARDERTAPARLPERDQPHKRQRHLRHKAHERRRRDQGLRAHAAEVREPAHCGAQPHLAVRRLLRQRRLERGAPLELHRLRVHEANLVPSVLREPPRAAQCRLCHRHGHVQRVNVLELRDRDVEARAAVHTAVDLENVEQIPLQCDGGTVEHIAADVRTDARDLDRG
eukprot:840124-Rhodomonas_salina.1